MEFYAPETNAEVLRACAGYIYVSGRVSISGRDPRTLVLEFWLCITIVHRCGAIALSRVGDTVVVWTESDVIRKYGSAIFVER